MATKLRDDDPRHHTHHVKTKLKELVDHLRGTSARCRTQRRRPLMCWRRLSSPAVRPSIMAAHGWSARVLQRIANRVGGPLAAGVPVAWGIVLLSTVGAVLMSMSTIVVAINARLLRRTRLW